MLVVEEEEGFETVSDFGRGDDSKKMGKRKWNWRKRKSMMMVIMIGKGGDGKSRQTAGQWSRLSLPPRWPFD